MPGETRESLFLFKTEAIILEVCGNNLVERDKTMMREGWEIATGEGMGAETV